MKTTKYFSYGNTSICYEVCGHGQAVVLLHGFTESQAIWGAFVAALQDSFQVITIDMPGHGNSGMLGDVHHMEDMAEVVRAVLDHLAINTCVVVGHSMGGYAALALARKYPAMIAGLGLFHSTALPDSEEARAGRDKAIAIIRKNRKDFLLQFIPSLFAPSNREQLKPQIDQLIQESQAMPAEAIIAAQEGMKTRQDGRDILEKANFPVMFIAGQQDARIPADLILEQAKLPVKSYVLLLKNVGHMGWTEAPEETIRFVRFFASNV